MSSDNQEVRQEPLVQSVKRSIDILLALAKRPMTLTEVMVAVGLHKTTTRRLLHSLSYRAMVVFDPVTRTYFLGPGCLSLGLGLPQSRGGFRVFAEDAIETAWKATGESIAVHVRVGRLRVCVDELASRELLRYESGVGATSPIFAGSAGRTLLAHMPPEELEALMHGVDTSQLVTNGVHGGDAFWQEIEIIREKGFALSEGENVQGAGAVSVPIMGSGGIVAALTALGPLGRFTRERRMECVEALRLAASEISARVSALDPR